MSDDAVNPEDPMEDGEVVSVLHEHVVKSAGKASEKLGGPLCADNLDLFLSDPDCLRVPTKLVFDGFGVDMHQFANPEFVLVDGLRQCILHIRPHYADLTESHPYIVAYMTAAINYGTGATAALCETYGAIVMQMQEDAFYEAVCRIADR